MHHDAETVDVQSFRERLVLLAHLVVDAVDRFVAAENSAADAVAGEVLAGGVQNLLQDLTALLASAENVFVEHLVAKRIAVREAQFLKLAENVVHAEAVCDRYVDVERLTRNACALFRAHDAQCSEVVQSVGELHQDDAHVFGHGEEHLAEALRLGDFV